MCSAFNVRVYLLSLADGGAEAERLVDQTDVIVDRLRNADHSDLELPLPDLLEDRLCATVGAVAADDVDVSEAVLHNAVHNLLQIEAT